MTPPIIGFRSWYIAKAREVPTVLMPRYNSNFKPGGEWDSWLAKRLDPPKPKKQARPHEIGTLLPLTRSGSLVWSQPGPVRFKCKAGHEQPHRACTCGLYAKFEDDLENGYGDAVGAIIAWGHIIFHGSEGFRAECARVVALSCPERKQAKSLAWVRTAAERINVPLVAREQLVMVAREFGSLVTWEYHFD